MTTIASMRLRFMLSSREKKGWSPGILSFAGFFNRRAAFRGWTQSKRPA
jgi:hypothetical protein